MLVILSGSSGAGKNTIINRLVGESGGAYTVPPSVTTRAPRAGERQGMPYYFVAREEFLARAASGEFYEYEEVHGNLYGTSRLILDGLTAQNKILLKDLDVYGTQNLVQKLSAHLQIVTIFITADLDVLRARLAARGEQEVDIQNRLARFSVEQTFAQKYRHVVPNDDLDTAVAQVKQIIEAERQAGAPRRGEQ